MCMHKLLQGSDSPFLWKSSTCTKTLLRRLKEPCKQNVMNEKQENCLFLHLLLVVWHWGRRESEAILPCSPVVTVAFHPIAHFACDALPVLRRSFRTKGMLLGQGEKEFCSINSFECSLMLCIAVTETAENINDMERAKSLTP